MRKKVLLISNNGQGFYNFKKELIEALLDAGFEVHFAVPPYEKLKKLTQAGAVYHELQVDRRGMNPLKDMGLIRQLHTLYHNLKPYVIILHTIKPNIYGSALAAVMKISYINSITGLGSALQSNSKLAKVLRKMYRYSLRKTSAVFFENQGNAEYFLKYSLAPKDKHIVVPGSGVNTSYYDRSFHAAESRQDGTTFLYIARVMRDKGIEEYLEAASAVKKEHPQARFQILGYYDDADYQERVEQLAADGVIEYLGVSNDTRVQMAQADCIVLPSYHEGMSNVLLEGASFELPLITTDICGCKEAVEDGVTGFLCGVRDSQSLTEAMKRFLLLSEKQREEMGRLGREKMIREFERRLVVDRYMEAVESLVK